MLLRTVSHLSRRIHSSQRLLSIHKCPSCGQNLPTPLPACNSCWSIHRVPSDLPHHQLFDLHEPNGFNIDTMDLKNRFRRAQMACHPDSWQSKGPEKHKIAESLSSQVNEAYKTLMNPLSRVEYILGQNGHPVLEQDTADGLEFMSEVMAARETIEEEGKDEIQLVLVETQGTIALVLESISLGVAAQEWETVKKAAVRLKYLEGIERAARQRLEEEEG
ncbi:hypothetical protein DL96DRAFT_1454424 [Flagelloscypha sp. PMI_526]|nr:hypothetical protein DL96DRAFT_1454424 [Flagelloscypha sp. PMI_526]